MSRTAMRCAIAAVGLLAVAALVRGGASHDSADLARLSERVLALHEQLAHEKQARARLEDEFGRWRAQLAIDRAPVRAAAAPVRVAATAPAPVAKPLAEAEQPRVGFDPQVVIAAGFAPSEVEGFRARVSEIQLERLYLRDRAQREGWLDTPSFAVQNQRIEGELSSLRSEFDEGLYDWMLFAEGQPNRVTVTEVLAGSAADSAGLRPGDLIVRYDERLVLSAGELGLATSTGQAGSQVEVEVQRDDQTLRVFLPRGPIGVKLEPRSVAPSPVS